MIDGSKRRKHQLAYELQSSCVFEKHSKSCTCNLENGLDKFNFSNLLALNMLSRLIRGAWNWPISCLNYSKTQKGRLCGV